MAGVMEKSLKIMVKEKKEACIFQQALSLLLLNFPHPQLWFSISAGKVCEREQRDKLNSMPMLHGPTS